MKLTQLAKAIAIIEPNHSILVYGPPKSGKTKLVGTAAKIPEIANIYWFDIENGSETLMHMGLTDEEMDKITIIKIPDTRDSPIAIETILKAFTAKIPISICEVHGKTGVCAECSKNQSPVISFYLPSLTHNDLVVLDSGSQLGDSAMASLCLGKDTMFKPGWDEYGIQGKWLGDILSTIQACKNTNFIVITHEMCIEDDAKKDVFFPLMGTKAFCMKVGKYFGTVAYVHKKLNKHTAGSGSTYLGDRITGSRINARIEDSKEFPDMRTILIEGGVIRASPHSNVTSFAPDFIPIEETLIGPISTTVKAPMSFAERIAAKKKGPSI